ncbi:hypothetical protein SE15_13895 [Thermanaerothrix daxensis]|uniref:DUF5655 domain-containing protein n=1 Tax=Thermanaerothrix daxensis TaxID=869279 RepID=A0A0P6XFK4_9CHLR|nr:DUF5655 domain-containing protein [Thermanaerothrix daxensis]KPL82166.1 hypothetical protein SE15_13895 [Thermanaerothrix daxensis]
MPLYRILSDGSVRQIPTGVFDRERQLQKLVEQNSETLLGVRFLASEFATGDRQRGRIDTLGLDENGTPTIIEFKKTGRENIINQGLFYLDWLVDHKGDFTLKAQEMLGTAIEIDWSNPRLILIAENFSEYDKYAVNRIGANIELWIYRLYGQDLLYLEQIYAAISPTPRRREAAAPADEEEELLVEYHVEDHLRDKPPEIVALFEQLRERILALDEEVAEKAVKHYVVYKHGRNFCEVWVQSRQLKIWLDIAPESLQDPFHLARDVRQVGHWGTGDVEVMLKSPDQLEAVFALITQSYQQTL